jgi:hypothetical protein
MEGSIKMESLAVLVVIIFMIALLGGPIATVLTYIPAKTLLGKIARRIPILILTFLSLVVCTQLIFSPIPLMGKSIGIFGLVTDYFAIRREFFPDFYLRKYLKGKGIGGGRSSGNDGHGPEGQH